MNIMRKTLFIVTIVFSFMFARVVHAKQQTVFTAKEFYEAIKNKTVVFNYGQKITITGILKEKGSSIIYNSSYLLISDSSDDYVYVKAVLANKNKISQYTKGQVVKINASFYQERDKVVVLKDAKTEQNVPSAQ